jgi:hypothetical protein
MEEMEMEGEIVDSPIDRACGILIGTIGIMGCLMPFCKRPVKDALQLSMTGIGIVLSVFSVISKTTNNNIDLNK